MQELDRPMTIEVLQAEVGSAQISPDEISALFLMTLDVKHSSEARSLIDQVPNGVIRSADYAEINEKLNRVKIAATSSGTAVSLSEVGLLPSEWNALSQLIKFNAISRSVETEHREVISSAVELSPSLQDKIAAMAFTEELKRCNYILRYGSAIPAPTMYTGTQYEYADHTNDPERYVSYLSDEIKNNSYIPESAALLIETRYLQHPESVEPISLADAMEEIGAKQMSKDDLVTLYQLTGSFTPLDSFKAIEFSNANTRQVREADYLVIHDKVSRAVAEMVKTDKLPNLIELGLSPDEWRALHAIVEQHFYRIKKSDTQMLPQNVAISADLRQEIGAMALPALFEQYNDANNEAFSLNGPMYYNDELAMGAVYAAYNYRDNLVNAIRRNPLVPIGLMGSVESLKA